MRSKMTMNFSLDKREMDTLAKQIVRDEAKDMQRRMDALGRRYCGRPVDEVKRALKADWNKSGGSLTEPELTEWATLISDGTRIEFKTK